MRRGDIIVNPWVSVDYCGELNPMYATIYLGNNFSLDYKGRKHRWADKVYKENAEHRCPWRVIGHIDLDEIIETAIRKAVKTENSSEIPNNCEPQTEDFQDWKDQMWAEAVIDPQTERSSE